MWLLFSSVLNTSTYCAKDLVLHWIVRLLVQFSIHAVFSQLFFCYSELCDFCSVQFSIHTLQGTVCCLGITTQHSKRNRIYFRCLVVQWVVLVVISLSKLFFCLRSREWILNTNISCQAKPSQSVNRGRRLTRSASRRPPVCYPFPRLTALLGSVTDS